VSWGVVAVALLTSLSTAASLFMVAAGLTLIFGAMRVINLAHGSLYMYGAFIAATIVGSATGDTFWYALALAPLAVVVLGTLLEVGLMRRVYRADHLVQLLATYGVLLILGDLALQFWGASPLSVSSPRVLSGSLAFQHFTFPAYELFLTGTGVLVGLALWFLLARTSLGWKVRASVEDAELLAVRGTNVKLLYTVVFAIGAFLAGLGGALITPLQGVDTGLGSSIIVAAFVVAVIGGLGSIAGAALGAGIIAVFQMAGALWLPAWEPTSLYVAMIVVLAIKPWGLLGVRDR
jgi:branched-subunit amino acid ABC-type transport system permease component